MNSMILIRGNKIAFSRLTGDFGDGGYTALDLKDTMLPYGWFLPACDHGIQVLYMMDKEQFYQPHTKDAPHSSNIGLKGVMATLEVEGVLFHRVEVNSMRQVLLTPITAGKDGFAIISPYEHLNDVMSMCVRLTTSIEDAVAMYCRHAPVVSDSVEIWDMAQVKAFLTANYKPRLQARVDRFDALVDNKE